MTTIEIWGHPRQMAKLWRAIAPMIDGLSVPTENTEATVTLYGTRNDLEQQIKQLRTLVFVRDVLFTDCGLEVKAVCSVRPKGDLR